MRSTITIRGIVFSALFAALTVVLGFLQVHLGFTPVPVTLGNLGVMLAGAFLGAGYGFFSIFLVVVLTALGLPLMDGYGGLSVILGTSGGYVWMWPFCALFTGLLVRRVKGNGVLAFIQVFVVVEVFGSLLCYITGVPWLAHAAGISLNKAMVGGFYPFLLGDAMKAFVTAVIILPIRRLYPVERLVGSSHAQVVALND